jgi:hypothetical protein
MTGGVVHMRMSALFLACLALSIVAVRSQAHSGGLDGEGCHTNRKTGEYHCHRGGGARAPAAAPLLPLRDDVPRYNAPRRGSPAPGGTFRNCSEARAAGAAPVHRGEPGYGAHLDRDNDGIGCEPYRGR